MQNVHMSTMNDLSIMAPLVDMEVVWIIHIVKHFRDIPVYELSEALTDLTGTGASASCLMAVATVTPELMLMLSCNSDRMLATITYGRQHRGSPVDCTLRILLWVVRYLNKGGKSMWHLKCIHSSKRI
jgi:hypothetical protein